MIWTTAFHCKIGKIVSTCDEGRDAWRGWRTYQRVQVLVPKDPSFGLRGCYVATVEAGKGSRLGLPGIHTLRGGVLHVGGGGPIPLTKYELTTLPGVVLLLLVHGHVADGATFHVDGLLQVDEVASRKCEGTTILEHDENLRADGDPKLVLGLRMGYYDLRLRRNVVDRCHDAS